MRFMTIASLLAAITLVSSTGAGTLPHFSTRTQTLSLPEVIIDGQNIYQAEIFLDFETGQFQPIQVTKTGVNATIEQPFDLAATQRAFLQDTGVSMELISIADSRCPYDMGNIQCVWAGQVTATIIFSEGAKTSDVSLTLPGHGRFSGDHVFIELLTVTSKTQEPVTATFIIGKL